MKLTEFSRFKIARDGMNLAHYYLTIEFDRREAVGLISLIGFLRMPSYSNFVDAVTPS
jgi:hypothetical protein